MGTATISISRDAQKALTGDLEAAKAHQKLLIKEAWEREISEVGMPVEGYDFRVDFDVMDSIIWEQGLAMTGDGTVNVRAIDNSMHAIPREAALLIPSLQRQHYAAVLQKKWALQAEIDNEGTVAGVRAV
ncbi:MAG: hypothetical protein LBO21_02705, partial [Synergistaceae bacterium]|nr:hypothetical protein [Synergistaceae bacterium]